MWNISSDKNRFHLKSIRVRATLAFGLATTLIVISNFRSNAAIKKLIASEDLVGHTQDVRTHLQELSGQLMMAQSDLRGYFMTGQDYYRDRHEGALKKIPTIIAELHQLTKDNSTQQKSVDALDEMIRARIARWNETQRLYQKQGFSAIQKRMQGDEGKQLTASIDTLVKQMNDEEGRLFSQRSLTSRANAERTLRQVGLTDWASTLIILISAYLLMLHIQKRKAVEASLLAVQEDLLALQRNLAREVAERTEDLRTVLEFIPQIVWQSSADGHTDYISSKWTEYTGLGVGDLRWQDVIHPDDMPALRRVSETSLTSPQPYELEIRIRGADGTYRWFLVRALPQLNADGSIRRWFGTSTDIHILKTMREQLIDERQRIQTVIQHAPVLLWAVDTNGVFTFYDGKSTKALGLTTQDRIGQNILELYEDRPDIAGNVKRALEGETVSEITYVRDLWLENTFAPLYSLDRKVTGVVGLSLDITEKHLREQLLRQNERKFAAIFDNSQIPKVVCSWPDYRMREVNSSWCETFGFAKDEVVGKTSLEIGHLTDQERILLARTEINETGRLKNFETRALAKDGRAFIISINASVFESDGKKYVAFTQHDVTEQRRLESQMLATFNQGAVGIIYASLSGHYIKVNDRFCEIIGCTREEVLSFNFRDITHPDDVPNDEDFIAGLRSGRKTSESREKRYLHKDGSIIWVTLTTSIVSNADEAPEYFISFAEDITARKTVENEKRDLEVREKSAQATSRLKSEFLANMSHEIRTPINGVMGMANILLDTDLSPLQKEYTESIVRSADTLLTLINDILDLSKAESGKIDLEEICFDLEQVVDDVERTVSYGVQKKKLVLLRNIDTSLPKTFLGDPTRLRQVLMNLVNNAIKFTTAGHVRVSLSGQPTADDHHVIRFEIEDTGIGIAEAALSRMFQAFSQADASTTRRFGGTGLGLSISKHLVTLMGGEIGVQSREGQGSTFWFNVKLKSAAVAPEIKPDINYTSLFRKLRILLAEDNSVNQLIAVAMLKKMGHSVQTVTNGLEVIEAAKAAPYDLILMDCQMPIMDGYEASKALRSDPALSTSNIKIIAMTANAMAGDREKCLESGMDDYVSKPAKIDELSAAIHRVFDARSV